MRGEMREETGRRREKDKEEGGVVGIDTGRQEKIRRKEEANLSLTYL